MVVWSRLPISDSEKDLWIDERRGILKCVKSGLYGTHIITFPLTIFSTKQRPERVINYNMARNMVSPGFMDSQINGAYDYASDPSAYEGDSDAYRRGLSIVAEKIEVT
jgi:hypothetical protein